MARPTVLLLNPPGNQRIMRDYFCSKVSKGSYYYHPVDLLFLSGWLGEHYHVRVLDSVVQRLSPRATLAYIKTLRPKPPSTPRAEEASADVAVGEDALHPQQSHAMVS